MAVSGDSRPPSSIGLRLITNATPTSVARPSQTTWARALDGSHCSATNPVRPPTGRWLVPTGPPCGAETINATGTKTGFTEDRHGESLYFCAHFCPKPDCGEGRVAASAAILTNPFRMPIVPPVRAQTQQPSTGSVAGFPFSVNPFRSLQRTSLARKGKLWRGPGLLCRVGCMGSCVP